jgi:hypothetical protein
MMLIDELESHRMRFVACINARETINNECFKGGDAKHIGHLQETKNGLKKCENLILQFIKRMYRDFRI